MQTRTKDQENETHTHPHTSTHTFTHTCDPVEIGDGDHIEDDVAQERTSVCGKGLCEDDTAKHDGAYENAGAQQRAHTQVAAAASP
jgi:hypothetical protein